MVKQSRPRSGDGYGNIYTPHAGSMIIQVQREGGLANRTIILTPRQVALLRALWSPLGRLALVVLAGTWIFFAVQSVRVPILTARVEQLQHTQARLDSLQTALGRLHQRYDQVRLLMSHVPGSNTARQSMPPDGARPSTPPASPATAAAPAGGPDTPR